MPKILWKYQLIYFHAKYYPFFPSFLFPYKDVTILNTTWYLISKISPSSHKPEGSELSLMSAGQGSRNGRCFSSLSTSIGLFSGHTSEWITAKRKSRTIPLNSNKIIWKCPQVASVQAVTVPTPGHGMACSGVPSGVTGTCVTLQRNVDSVLSKAHLKKWPHILSSITEIRQQVLTRSSQNFFVLNPRHWSFYHKTSPE